MTCAFPPRHPTQSFNRPHARSDQFKHLIILNSSVRGPFMPVYMDGLLHWTDALVSLLSQHTRVAGATINCGGNAKMITPHVQSYLLAMDR